MCWYLSRKYGWPLCCLRKSLRVLLCHHLPLLWSLSIPLPLNDLFKSNEDQMKISQVNNVLIEPLFCTTSSSPKPGESLSVYIKRSQSTIDITWSIKMDHIIFGGIEDFPYPNNSQSIIKLGDCLSHPLKCYGDNSNSVLACPWSGGSLSLSGETGIQIDVFLHSKTQVYQRQWS